MAATVKIEEANGPSTAIVYTVKSSSTGSTGTVRFKNADNATVDSVNPLVVPTANTEYSFTKQLRPDITAAPATQISNMISYSDGTPTNMSTGVKIWVRTAGTTTHTATSVPVETTDPPRVPGSTATAMVNWFTHLSTAAQVMSTSTFSSTFTGRTNIKFTTLCMEVEIGSTQGPRPSSGTEKYTVAWDEI